jgi:hypothetical protein
VGFIRIAAEPLFVTAEAADAEGITRTALIERWID